MLGGVLVMGGLGVVVGIGLGIASKIFHVEVDPKVEAIDEALPGANCGGCGLPGCSANAAAIAAGKSSANSCVAGGPEIAAEIAEIMGVKLEAKEPDIASPGCTYGFQDADVKYTYNGILDCRALSLINGGLKVCPIGCLGLGTCVRACPFDALSMGEDNLPVVDIDKCTGCGTCERICPKHIITLSSYTRRIQHEYTLDECSAPCQRTCPAGIDIPSYIHKISIGDFEGSVRIIKESNPFPLVCGRICVTPCEDECRRNLVDEPVAINNLKRFVTDYEMKSGKRIQIPRAPATDKSVAIVGGGAEGLTAGYFLNRMGHDVILYESTSKLGGLLRKGLPENRLPRNVLDWEINGILDAGVEAITNKRLGRDFSILSLLKEGHLAVLVAMGGWDTQISERIETGEGEPVKALPGVQILLDFLLNYREGKKSLMGERVMILGGGKASIEAAKACHAEGAKDIHIVFRSERISVPLTGEEIKQAEGIGIHFHYGSTLNKMLGEADKLTDVELISLVKQDGESREPETIPVDSLLLGAGRFPELIYVPQRDDANKENQVKEPVKWETIIPYSSPFAENDLGLFRPGEETGDYKAVIEAIGSGRRAAASVQKYLTGEIVEPPDNMIRKKSEVLNLREVEPVQVINRVKMPQLPEATRLNNPLMEIATGYSEAQAVEEAKRCLQCGLICYRREKGSLH